MFVLCFFLAGLYTVSAVDLLLQGDTGALIVGIIAIAFAGLGGRNLKKRKARRGKI